MTYQRTDSTGRQKIQNILPNHIKIFEKRLTRDTKFRILQTPKQNNPINHPVNGKPKIKQVEVL